MVEQNNSVPRGKRYLHSSYFIDNGWIKKLERVDGCYISYYSKGYETVSYDGVYWKYVSVREIKSSRDGGIKIEPRIIEFIEDLP